MSGQQLVAKVCIVVIVNIRIIYIYNIIELNFSYSNEFVESLM